jgi:ethanolamine utilization protein EutA
MPSDSEGGRIFFARSRRAPDQDSEIRLVSVGLDIGSSTSHLAFSRIVVRRRMGRSQVVRRELLHESEIFLTPYTDADTIDTEALGGFIGWQYEKAEIEPEMIDTGALILTGTASRKSNARAIGELFASETGRFVAVAAGDGLETTLAAHGSGAVAASAHDGTRVMNVDIGGGTSKIAVCEGGEVIDLTALDVGARLMRLDGQGRVSHIEPAGVAHARAGGLLVGEMPAPGALDKVAASMAARLFEACGGAALSQGTLAMLRLPPLRPGRRPDQLSFSGGVAEYIHGREARRFGDLGPWLADAVMALMRPWGPVLRFADQGIRATVIGASQHSVQLSGNTIFVAPTTILPLNSLPVIVPHIQFDNEAIDAHAVVAAIGDALMRLDLAGCEVPVALGYRWQGSATHARIAAFSAGVISGLALYLERGHPLVLVGEGDVGGLIGIHASQSGVAAAVVSIDGVVVSELDHIDIGELLQVSGGVPVVVKSLVFPR